MIQSKNAGIETRAKKLYDAWKVAYDAYRKQVTDSGKDPNTDIEAIKAMPESIRFYPTIPLLCDCCMSSYDQGVTFFFDAHGGWAPEESYWKRHPRGFVEVAGTVYYGCKDACAQALFMIHHQYAMRAQSEEGRFVEGQSNMERGGRQTVDLDRVVSVSERNHGVVFHLERGDDIYFDTWYQKDPEKAVAEYIAAWKKRRVRPEIVS